MENELEVVNIRLVKEPSLYSEQTLDSPQAVVELIDGEGVIAIRQRGILHLEYEK